MAKKPQSKKTTQRKRSAKDLGEPKSLPLEERRHRAYELRCYGLTLREIAEQLKTTHTTVMNDIKIMTRQAREESKERVEDMLLIESTKLDRITAEMMRQLIETRPQTHDVTCPACTHKHRVVVRQPLSPRERQGAANVLLGAMDRRARMFGLDQPAKTHISVGDVSGIFESLADVIIDFVPETKRDELSEAIERRLANLA